MKQLAYSLICSALGVLHAVAGDCDPVVIGPLRTVSKAMPLAEGMAVKDGRIAYIGTAAEARKRLSTGGTLIELPPGQSVLPGIIDAHIHMLDAGMKRRLCMMEEPSSREQVFQTVAEFARKNPDFEWITGYGWPPSLFADGNPHKKDLDAIVPDRPVFLFADDGHSAWLNSKGLATLGINKKTADPPLGRIERDPRSQGSVL